MRICLIGSCRFPIAEPFAGGLEAHTADLARRLDRRGHEVTVFAAAGSDPAIVRRTLPVAAFTPSSDARADVGAPPDRWMAEHHAYLGLMLELARSAGRYDVVHNNSLHHLPVAMAEMLPVPVVTTLHTPPVPWLESAVQLSSGSHFLAVSAHTARAWSHAVTATVVRNGVDTRRWVPGPGGPRAIWVGRLVPEKGPHLAIDAARRAGLAIDLVGPVHDRAYVEAQVLPRLGPDAVHRGHLGGAALTAALGAAAVAVVSPVWDEPYGLVAAEALACGTPVAAFARGGLSEIVDASSGRLAAPGDVDALAEAIRGALACRRADARRRAETACDAERMVDGYEAAFGAARALGAVA